MAGVPPLDQLTEALLRVSPRVAATGPGLLWADARGLAERPLAAALCAIVRAQGAASVQAGIARTAIVAEVAARSTRREVTQGTPQGTPQGAPQGTPQDDGIITVVAAGEDRIFLAPYPLSVLCSAFTPHPAVLPLLAGVGIETCGALAGLGQEEVEVRFAADGVRLWRLARGEDHRRPFGALPRARPRASCAWTDYALRDIERLLFVINRLVGQVCETLRSRGEAMRDLTLRFALANRSAAEQPFRAARPTADPSAWLRLIRAGLGRIRLPDAVTGMTVRAGVIVAAHEHQGDIFDRGFATARATEQAVAQLLDTCGMEVVALSASSHPLLERRARWQVRESVILEGIPSSGASAVLPSLTLQLLPEPQPVDVVTEPRRDHDVPVRYQESAKPEVGVLVAAGPDRVTGGTWEATPYAREYFHCVTADGRLVLLFRAVDRWYLHGWWD
jgi:protein ImuB